MENENVDKKERVSRSVSSDLFDAPQPELQAELVEALSWYISFYHDVRAVAPEYFERCADLNATEYLFSEAQSIYTRATSE